MCPTVRCRRRRAIAWHHLSVVLVPADVAAVALLPVTGHIGCVEITNAGIPAWVGPLRGGVQYSCAPDRADDAH